jgi:hypothetical protein
MIQLPSACCHKIPVINIEIVKDFIDRGIDPNIFMIETSKSFDCFQLLMISGYRTDDIYDINQLIYGARQWSKEEKQCLVRYLMDDDKLREKFDLDKSVFSHIDRLSHSSRSMKMLFEMIATNYPMKISAQTFLQYHICASIFEPYIAFSSQDLVKEYIKRMKAFVRLPISLLVQYADHSDYFTSDVFCLAFSNRCQETMAYFIQEGFVPQEMSDAFPKKIGSWYLESFDYLKSKNVWDGFTFNWENHEYICRLDSRQSFMFWLRENGCPEHVIDKITWM